MKPVILFVFLGMLVGCQTTKKEKLFTGEKGEIKLITLAPGHFHAALIQKSSVAQINDTVYVYAPEGEEVKTHLALIESYNSRKQHPTHWHEIVHTGNDYVAKMLQEKKGNVVVLAGNNRLKTTYILRSVETGLNVLSDKPMAIDKLSFDALESAYQLAEENDVLLYDIMTERFVDYNIVNRLLMQEEDLFGELLNGSPENPAVILNSVHHFYKEVSGKPLIRPFWYYDVSQQGEGIVDVTTHLIDLVHWKCFPDIPLDYKTDIQVSDASHWTTPITKEEFTQSTGLADYPSGLPVGKDSMLHVYANGSISYQVKGVHVGLSVAWNFQPPENTGDIHSCVIRGSKATLLILQGEKQQYIPKLYIKRADSVAEDVFERTLRNAVGKLEPDYRVEIVDAYDDMKELLVHPKVKTSHEDHFSFVADTFFGYLVDGNMPEWENKNTLAKYYITTTALEIARGKDEL